MFGFIGLLIVVTAFTALNLDHRSDVSLGFHTFDAVPVFLTSLVAFTLGAVLVVPLHLPRRRVARQALAPATQRDDLPAAEAAPGPQDAAVTPESPAEGERDDPMELREERPEPQARWWRFGGRRRKEAQD